MNNYEIIAHDAIAMITLLMLFYCKIRGIDGVVDSLLTLIIGFYFGKKVFSNP